MDKKALSMDDLDQVSGGFGASDVDKGFQILESAKKGIANFFGVPEPELEKVLRDNFVYLLTNPDQASKNIANALKSYFGTSDVAAAASKIKEIISQVM